MYLHCLWVTRSKCSSFAFCYLPFWIKRSNKQGRSKSENYGRENALVFKNIGAKF